ncbi:MAG: PAS domain-containing sensor histidine kinase [Stellaceae bacterium]
MTGQRRAAEPLARHEAASPLGEAHLLQAQAVAALGSWEYDLRTRGLACSPELLRICGWSADRRPTLAELREALHAEDRVLLNEDVLLRHSAERSSPAARYFRVIRADGEIRHLRGRSFVAYAEQGRPLVICGTMQDVTDEVAVERAAGAEALHLRSMFEHATWGIFRTSPNGRYLSANPALARIYGYASPLELQQALTDIGGQLYVDPQRRDEFVAQMREKGAVSGFESQVHRRDGAVIWISECCREVRGGDGTLLHYEGTVEEITRRKAAEQELRRTKERAEAANRTKSFFLANMSHELRTPLNAVLGFTEILRDELYGPLGHSRYRDYVHDIHGSGKHLLDVISNILDLTTIEAGHLVLDEQDVDLAEVMGMAERVIAETARRRGLELEVVAPAEPVLLRADPTRLKQILLNLLANAVKFTDPGGLVRADVAADDSGIELRVSDTGIGIAPRDIERVMQPFEQVGGPMARKTGGTGLGLPLARELARLHGGTLSLASRRGAGTTARLWLPPDRLLAPA